MPAGGRKQRRRRQNPARPDDIVPGGLERLSAAERARISGQDPRNRREPKAQAVRDELRDAKQGLFVRVARTQGLSEPKISAILNYVSNNKRHTRNARTALEAGDVPELKRLLIAIDAEMRN